MSACVVCAPVLTAECLTPYSQPMTNDDLAKLGTTYLRARAKAEAARLVLRDAIRAAAGTMSELQMAKVTGVQRETVRKALGK